MKSGMKLKFIIEFDMIESKIKTDFDFNRNDFPDEALIAAYICYLGRFYYIAENNVAAKVREYLHSTFSDAMMNHDLINENYIRKIFKMTMDILPQRKQNAILGLDGRIKLFRTLGATYQGPTLSTNNIKANINKSICTFTYTFDWLFENDQLKDKLKIPTFSPHIIFVPLSLGFMTKFTVDNLKNKESIQLLATMVEEVNTRIATGDVKFIVKINEIYKQYKLI